MDDLLTSTLRTPTLTEMPEGQHSLLQGVASTVPIHFNSPPPHYSWPTNPSPLVWRSCPPTKPEGAQSAEPRRPGQRLAVSARQEDIEHNHLSHPLITSRIRKAMPIGIGAAFARCVGRRMGGGGYIPVDPNGGAAFGCDYVDNSWITA